MRHGDGGFISAPNTLAAMHSLVLYSYHSRIKGITDMTVEVDFPDSNITVTRHITRYAHHLLCKFVSQKKIFYTQRGCKICCVQGGHLGGLFEKLKATDLAPFTLISDLLRNKDSATSIDV